MTVPEGDEVMTAETLQASQLEHRDYVAAVEDYYRRGWTDGLPVIPPEPARVGAFLDAGGVTAREVVGAVPTRDVIVTAEDVAEVSARTGQHLTCVYVPTAPNPTSGFLLLVPQSQLIPLAMSVDAAMKMIVTCGVVLPEPPAARVAHLPGGP